MAVGDIYRVTLEGAVGTDDMVTVHHFRLQSGGGSGNEDSESLAKAFEAQTLPEWFAMISNQYGALQVKVRGVTNPIVGYDHTVSGVGDVAGEFLPLQNAVLVNWRTAKFGRSFRGKTYIPAIGEASVANGAVLSAFSTLIDTWATVLETLAGTDPVTASFRHVVYSRELLEANDVTSWVMSPYAATQRRRKPGVGG
jgi:hypothetical protein